MLPYFPTPYPDELWYSVLCRFHIRSCNKSMLLNRSSEEPFFLFPNRSIFNILQTLPEDVFDVKKLVINLTLFPYFCRIKPFEEKQRLLESVSQEKQVDFGWKTTPRTKQTLRYCPICQKEEVDRYGESYWHREHQLPFMTVCPRHHCRLIEYQRVTEWKQSIVLPDFIETVGEPDFEVKEYESKLADMMYRYLVAPFELSPTKGYSNLDHELEAKYRTVCGSRIGMIDTEKLYEDLVGFYGPQIIRSCFGGYFTQGLSMKLRSWNFPSPERYIILATLIGQMPEETFGKPNAAGEYERQLCGSPYKRLRYKRQRTA